MNEACGMYVKRHCDLVKRSVDCLEPISIIDSNPSSLDEAVRRIDDQHSQNSLHFELLLIQSERPTDRPTG